MIIFCIGKQVGIKMTLLLVPPPGLANPFFFFDTPKKKFPYDTGKMHESRVLPVWYRYFFARAVQVQNYLYGKGEIACMAPVKLGENKK
jgi:hypothetical protein